MADRIIGMVSALVQENDSIHEAFSPFSSVISLVSSQGDQLDTIGDLLSWRRRKNTDDATYRAELIRKIAFNASTGTFDDIVNAIKLVFGESIIFNLAEIAPAVLRLDLRVDDPEENHIAYIKKAVSAGVSFYLVIIPLNPFQYDTGLGYDQGHYAKVVQR